MSHLNQPHFQDAEKAREYLETVRWPHGPVCPHCGTIGAHYALKGKTTRPGLWKCKDCREQFSVTVGTVFERSKIKLNVWLQAVYLLCSSKKGMSSHQLHRILGVTYKTAWFMTHRIREAMANGTFSGPLGSGGGTVEVDETYWGNKSADKMAKAGFGHKMKIVSLVERGGEVRSFHVTNVTGKTLRPILNAQISKDATLMTDEAKVYHQFGRVFADHQTVNHGINEYVRGDAYTNTVEGYFSILKRGLIGTYHHVSEDHLKRYVGEFDFRYNNRKVSDQERTLNALRGIGGKRLTYRRINAAA
jgi:transposase-like protein